MLLPQRTEGRMGRQGLCVWGQEVARARLEKGRAHRIRAKDRAFSLSNKELLKALSR